MLLAVGMMLSLLAACGAAQKSSSEYPSVENTQDNTSESDSGNETEVNTVNLDFSVFGNVEITGVELSELSAEEQAVLYQKARYCQAMTEADTETMTEITSPDMIFTHMSGRQQTREEYFADKRMAIFDTLRSALRIRWSISMAAMRRCPTLLF